jgi:hypothetical protein
LGHICVPGTDFPEPVRCDKADVIPILVSHSSLSVVAGTAGDMEGDMIPATPCPQVLSWLPLPYLHFHGNAQRCVSCAETCVQMSIAPVVEATRANLWSQTFVKGRFCYVIDFILIWVDRDGCSSELELVGGVNLFCPRVDSGG